MKRVILDFDNTMGVKGCDVDDGLALLMLLGNPDLCTVEGLCTAYGNSDIETVHANTLRLVGEMGLDLQVHKGAASPADASSEAAAYLAQAVAAEPGQISVLATGSLTNLRGALEADPAFFGNVAEVAVMGGITQSLVINGKIMNELNLSCDAQATCDLLGAGCPVTIASSQNCLPAFFQRSDFEHEFGRDSWFYRTCDYWFSDMDERYDWNGFTCWDIVAAGALIRPDLFVADEHDIALDKRLIGVGLLDVDPMPGAPAGRANLPRIADAEAFCQFAFESWHRAVDRLGL